VVVGYPLPGWRTTTQLATDTFLAALRRAATLPSVGFAGNQIPDSHRSPNQLNSLEFDLDQREVPSTHRYLTHVISIECVSLDTAQHGFDEALPLRNLKRKKPTMNSENYFAPIAALDLTSIKAKLMNKESGEGWSLSYADTVEFEYRRFLYLVKRFPSEPVAPRFDVDVFWHYHILDTKKYAADCEQIYGYFLHHCPSIRRQGEDEIVQDLRGKRMRELYEAIFGEPSIRPQESSPTTGSSATTAWCMPAMAENAWCVPATVKAAWCMPATQRTAWCMPAVQNTAWCMPATPGTAGPGLVSLNMGYGHSTKVRQAAL
jgi:hypothetical protein